MRFQIAPLRPYKFIIGVAAIAIMIWLFSIPERSISDRLTIRIAGTYLIGWFLILFGDGSSGVVIESSLRSYYVTLGIGILIFSLLGFYMIAA